MYLLDLLKLLITANVKKVEIIFHSVQTNHAYSYLNDTKFLYDYLSDIMINDCLVVGYRIDEFKKITIIDVVK